MKTLFAALSATLIAILAPGAWAEVADIGVEEAYARANAGEIILVDVRTPNEWKSTGLPAHAKPIQLQRGDFVSAILATRSDAPEKPIALICRSGGRSAIGAKTLDEFGFKDVINVKGGMSGRAPDKGWLESGLPTSPYNVDELAALPH